ncbi:MAG TPA: fibronectin type III domain-containing protein [Niastella sp.]
MTHRITNGHKQSRDNDLISFAHGVRGKMDNNPTFPEPPAALANLKKVLPEYEEVNYKARGGDEEMRFIRKAMRANVIALLSELAEYVTLTCNGDPAKLVSSGFELNKERGTKAMLPIKELKVTIDRTGEAVTQVKKVAGAKAYIHQYTPDPLTGDNVWVNKVTTNPSYTFTGLKSTEKYWFQVIAIGLNGQETASPPVSRVIQ